jgi:hypothetical protein
MAAAVELEVFERATLSLPQQIIKSLLEQEAARQVLDRHRLSLESNPLAVVREEEALALLCLEDLAVADGAMATLAQQETVHRRHRPRVLPVVIQHLAALVVVVVAAGPEALASMEEAMELAVENLPGPVDQGENHS